MLYGVGIIILLDGDGRAHEVQIMGSDVSQRNWAECRKSPAVFVLFWTFERSAGVALRSSEFSAQGARYG